MAEETLSELIIKVFTQIGRETLLVLPKIFIALIVVAFTFLVIKALNISFRKIFEFAKLDTVFKRFSLPFSVDRVILFLADLGVVLISLYVIINLFFEAKYLQLMNEGLYYGARVVSIAVISIVVLVIFNALIGSIRVETRLRSYTMFVVILLITAMLIDITALSEPVKNALTSGLSVGVGASICVFAIWFFFHDYLDKYFQTKTPSAKGKSIAEKK